MATDSVDAVSNFKVRVRMPDGARFNQATYYHTDYLADDVKALAPPALRHRIILAPGAEIDFELAKGRHDPCVGLRATPIAEAMVALVLMDHFLRDRAQNAVDPRGDLRGGGPDDSC